MATTRFQQDAPDKVSVCTSAAIGAKTELRRAPSWLKLIDLALLITVLLLILTEHPIFYFHLIFVLLTFGAFHWQFGPYVLRASIIVSITTMAIIVFILSGLIPPGELIEIPMLLFILIMVFTIARQRALAEDALRQTNENLEQRILARTGALHQETLAHQATIQTLRTSEERYRRLVQLSFEAIMIHTENEILSLNPAAMALLGLASAEEIQGRSFWEFIHPDQRDGMANSLCQIREAGIGAPPTEWQLIRLDGHIINVEMATIPIHQNGQPALQSVVRDITARKEAEQARLDERTRIARDLHDSLGQSLSYLHLKLDNLATHVPFHVEVGYGQDLARMRDVANTAYEQVRGLLAALLPANTMKLADALRQRTLAIHEAGALQIQVTNDGRERALPAVLQQQIFSLCCEAIANIVKHAQARRAKVALWWEPATLIVVIEDDGVGFDLTVSPKSDSFGIRIMQARAAQMNGHLEIQSQYLLGTKVRLQVPI